ncbi:MAG TPA: hypothetical protein VG389_19895 [Myxococcota bacterium]|jgi:hypothetical protein|nr:hypothetical protein [Myxococcota bacterium]
MDASRVRAAATRAAALLALAAATLAAGCSHGQPDRLVGESCATNDDCRDMCATGADFPGGFCTTTCFDDGDCPGGTVCADVQGGICLFPCDGEATDYCSDLIDVDYRCRDRNTPDGRVILVCMGN